MAKRYLHNFREFAEYKGVQAIVEVIWPDDVPRAHAWLWDNFGHHHTLRDRKLSTFFNSLEWQAGGSAYYGFRRFEDADRFVEEFGATMTFASKAWTEPDYHGPGCFEMLLDTDSLQRAGLSWRSILNKQIGTDRWRAWAGGEYLQAILLADEDACFTARMFLNASEKRHIPERKLVKPINWPKAAPGWRTGWPQPGMIFT